MSYKFTDIRPSYNGRAWYWFPNESIEQYPGFLDRIPWLHNTDAVKGGSIASGGEVPLVVMLPRCAALTIVDHCYESLWVTCTKIELFRHLSTPDIFKLYRERDYAYFCQLMADLEKHIPTELHGKVNLNATPAGAEVGKGPKDGDYQQWHRGGTRYWCSSNPGIKPAWVDAAKERLGNIVEVIHGDFRDLGTGYDLLYLSNATGHVPHDNPTGTYKGGPNLEAAIQHILASGGYLLAGGTPTGLVNASNDWGLAKKPSAIKPEPTPRRYTPVFRQIRECRWDPYWGQNMYFNVPLPKAIQSKIPRPKLQLYKEIHASNQEA